MIYVMTLEDSKSDLRSEPLQRRSTSDLCKFIPRTERVIDSFLGFDLFKASHLMAACQLPHACGPHHRTAKALGGHSACRCARSTGSSCHLPVLWRPACMAIVVHGVGMPGALEHLCMKGQAAAGWCRARPCMSTSCRVRRSKHGHVHAGEAQSVS